MEISLIRFETRYARFIAHWSTSSLWSNVDAIEIKAGDLEEFNHISCIHTWFFDMEFSNTTMVFTKDSIFVCTGKKKAELLSSIPNVKIIEKDSIIKSFEATTLGYIRDSSDSLLDSFQGTTLDVSNAFFDLLSVKDQEELNSITESAKEGSNVFTKYLQPELEKLIVDEKKISHADFAINVEKFLFNSRNKEHLDVLFPPVIQSGDRMAESKSNDSTLKLASTGIFCLLGTKYKGYGSMLGRTFLIDCSETDEGIYRKMENSFEFLLKQIQIGVKLSDVYKNTIETMDWLENKPSSLGLGIGIAKDSYLEINAKNDYEIRVGNAFVVSLKVESNRDFYICDTVIVTENGVVVCTKVPRSFSEISYSVEEEEDGDIEDEVHDLDEGNILTEKRTKETAESERRAKQMELMKKKSEEPKTRKETVVEKSKYSIDESLAKGEIISYKKESDLKKNQTLYTIQLDEKNETILVLINQVFVPFHVATIKNFSKSDEGDFAILRINFKQPGPNYLPSKSYPNAVFIKEVSCRSKDPKNIVAIIRNLTVLRKKITDREKEIVEQRDLVVQEPLKIKGQSKIRLRDVYIRPNPRGKKTLGVIEAHENGLRFIAKEEIDILYANIKHAFYQEAKDEVIVLVHFHLHNPILIGKKKQYDIQFYAEVMEEVDQLVGNKRKNTTDMESMEEERREAILRQKLNSEFLQFAKKVEEKSGIEFDSPYFELGFIGTPNRSSVKLYPTVYCLVALTEMPFFVVSLADIELAYFERVHHGLKNFDMVFIFKDYAKAVINVASIPVKALDTIKEWLTSVKINYFEGVGSLVWPKILKTIREDDEWDPWGDEGWNAILNVDEEEQQEDEDDQDVFEIESGDSEVEVASESSDDFESDEVESEDSFAGEADLSDEEVGADWDELEEKALNKDREKDLSDSDEAPKKKKKK